MVDPKRAAELIRKHFAEITTEQFVENMKKYCPEIFEDDVADTAPSSSNTDESEEKAATA